jgi:hypothetical protein
VEEEQQDVVCLLASELAGRAKALHLAVVAAAKWMHLTVVGILLGLVCMLKHLMLLWKSGWDQETRRAGRYGYSDVEGLSWLFQGRLQASDGFLALMADIPEMLSSGSRLRLRAQWWG